MNAWTKYSKLKPTANVCLSTAACPGPLFARTLLLVSAEAWWPAEDTLNLPWHPSAYCLPPEEAAGAEGLVGFHDEGVTTKH